MRKDRLRLRCLVERKPLVSFPLRIGSSQTRPNGSLANHTKTEGFQRIPSGSVRTVIRYGSWPCFRYGSSVGGGVEALVPRTNESKTFSFKPFCGSFIRSNVRIPFFYLFSYQTRSKRTKDQASAQDVVSWRKKSATRSTKENEKGSFRHAWFFRLVSVLIKRA